MEVSIPEVSHTTEAELEKVKSWIITYSLDLHVDQSLPQDERGVYLASLSTPGTELLTLPCIITGYPVLRAGVRFDHSNFTANQMDWEKFNQIVKISKCDECIDVKTFITNWCGKINPN